MPPPPSLPYKVDTSRPSLRTNWTSHLRYAKATGRAHPLAVDGVVKAGLLMLVRYAESDLRRKI
jgi:hypothetical protein